MITDKDREEVQTLWKAFTSQYGDVEEKAATEVSRIRTESAEQARIKSILRKAADLGFTPSLSGASFSEKEIQIIKLLNTFPDKIAEGGKEHSPAIIANYCYDLAKEFNQYYHEVSILKESDQALRDQRLMMILQIAKVLSKGMGILGITLPERM